MKSFFEFRRLDFFDVRSPPALVCHYDSPVGSVEIQNFILKGGEKMFKVNIEKVEAEFLSDYKTVQEERATAIAKAESDANAEVQNTTEYAELLSRQEQERAELVAKYAEDKKAEVAALYDSKIAIYEKYVERVEESTQIDEEEE